MSVGSMQIQAVLYKELVRLQILVPVGVLGTNPLQTPRNDCIHYRVYRSCIHVYIYLCVCKLICMNYSVLFKNKREKESL